MIYSSLWVVFELPKDSKDDEFSDEGGTLFALFWTLKPAEFG